MKPKVGRPRTGDDARRYRPGDAVSRFVKLTGRYPAPVAARVRALADERGEPLWSVLCLAVESYLADLPAAERRTVDKHAKRTVRELERDAAEGYERNLLTKARARHAKG
jgi:hypothetical protein